MDSVELVKKICKERNIAISRLERDCGFSNGYIRRLKEGKFPSDRLQIIANYLDVSIDYLLTGDVQKNGQDAGYYEPETLEMAQALYDNPDLRALMKAAMELNRDSIPNLTKLLYDLKGTNPDG